MHLALTRTRATILILVLILCVSCSVKEHHQTLAFFFDGVPDPNLSAQTVEERAVENDSAPDDRAVDEGRNASKQQVQSVHSPYQERACDSCHDRSSSSFLTAPADELCFLCHDSEPFEMAYVHGPVAVAACTACHQPHQSKEPYLLLNPVMDVCMSCHAKADVEQNDNHDMETVCTECHNPHSGEDPYLMW